MALNQTITLKIGCYCETCNMEHYIITNIPKIQSYHPLQAIVDIHTHIYSKYNVYLKKKYTCKCITRDELGVGHYELETVLIGIYNPDMCNKSLNSFIKEEITRNSTVKYDWEIPNTFKYSINWPPFPDS